ncbi:hypothetical protein FBU30_009268 [Linnemannia zychae]|nr:hypothetical protein FBU30_009268 [Linnemannia zychae]
MVEAGRFYLDHFTRPSYLLPIDGNGMFVINPSYGPRLPPELGSHQVIDRRSLAGRMSIPGVLYGTGANKTTQSLARARQQVQAQVVLLDHIRDQA